MLPVSYSAAAIPFSILSGFLIDRVGTRISLAVFMIFSIIGLSVFAISTTPSSTDYSMCLIGRAIYGMGGEGLVIWF